MIMSYASEKKLCATSYPKFLIDCFHIRRHFWEEKKIEEKKALRPLCSPFKVVTCKYQKPIRTGDILM